MIDIEKEKLLSPPQIAKLVPGSKGKGVHIATVYRWMQTGYHGIRLESVVIGGKGRATSKEALQRFLDALTAQANGHDPEPAPRHTATRRKQIEAAEKRLAAAGV